MAHTYNAADVSFIFGVVDTTEEPGDDTFIEVAYDEDLFAKKVGVKGTATRSTSNNLGASIKVTCMYTSKVNSILMGIAIADQKSGGGIQPATLRDKGSKLELHAMPQCWIKRKPDFSLAKQVGTIVWEFDCEAAVGMHGGR